MAILENHPNNEVGRRAWKSFGLAPRRRCGVRASVRAALEVNSHSDAVVPQLLMLLLPPLETARDRTMMAIESLKCAILTNEINRCPSIITMTVVNRSVRQKLHRCDCHSHPWSQ